MIWIWGALIAIGQFMDAWTTKLALAAGCTELNPIVAQFSVPGMFAYKAFWIMMMIWFTVRLHRRGERGWTIGVAAAYVLAGVGAAAWNLHVLPSCP